jgi:hypothetical protein
MSEQNQQQQENEPTDEQIDASTDVAALRTEAKNRRLKLREVEGERDALRERVNGFEQEQVQGLIRDRFEDPDDFFSQVEMDHLRGEDGTVDSGLVGDAVNSVLETKPHWAKVEKQERSSGTAQHQGVRNTRPAVEPPSFGKAIKGAKR